MKEVKEICYPYAYGRLNSSIQDLSLVLEMDCIRADIDVDENVFKMLGDRIEKLQKAAIEESLEHNV
tara:strand:- start:791 stop:991 length:201 start_codon:yes stop_codon:yes gene_type:complete